MSFVVVTEHPSLIAYVDSLQRKNADALSFYPKQVFEREQQKGRLFLGMLDGEPCGYLYVGAHGEDIKCHQVCIQYDARRRLYGAGLVLVMEDYARQSRAKTITLRCGFDLEANDFWRDLGYQVVAHQQGGVRRMRTINVWKKIVVPDLVGFDLLEPQRGTHDASLWRKHKKTGIVSQFVRGPRMRDYRATLLESAQGSSTDVEVATDDAGQIE